MCAPRALPDRRFDLLCRSRRARIQYVCSRRLLVITDSVPMSMHILWPREDFFDAPDSGYSTAISGPPVREDLGRKNWPMDSRPGPQRKVGSRLPMRDMLYSKPPFCMK